MGGQDSARPTFVRYQVLAVACSLAVLTYVQRQGVVAGTPYIKKDLGLNDEQMGLLAGTVWLIAYGLFQMPGGLLGDRLGARHVLTVLVLGWSLLVGVLALTAGLPPGTWLVFGCLAALRFLFGGFQAGGMPVLARVIADWMPARQRGFAQGMSWMCSRVGGFLAPILVGWLIRDVFHGWAVPMWLLASLGLLWCAFFWTWFRNRPEEMPRVNAAERDLIASGRQARPVVKGPVPWSLFLRSRNVWALSLMYGFVGFAGNFNTALLPIYLHDHRHYDGRTTDWLAGLPLACGAVSCVLGGILTDWLVRRTGSRKWGRRLVGLIGLTLAIFSVLLNIWAQEVWLVGLSFCAWFFFNDTMIGPAWASCADVGERYTGTLSGAMNMTGAFMGAVGMWLAGRWLRQGQYTLMFSIFACSYALAALFWLFVDVTKPLVPKEATPV
jgi:ACS family glucarate transporter-like MFS transporter